MIYMMITYLIAEIKYSLESFRQQGLWPSYYFILSVTQIRNLNPIGLYARWQIGVLLLLIVLMSGCIDRNSIGVQTTSDNTSLIPREIVLFSNRDREDVQLSPDGSRISFCAPVNGVPNLWVGPAKDPGAAKPVTNYTRRSIGANEWAYTNRHILYIQDENGDGNYRIYCLNLSSGDVKNLTPMRGVRAQILAKSPKYPQEIMIGLNDRDPQYYDIYRLNIETGNMTLIMKNDRFQINQKNGPRVGIDGDYRIRFASKITPVGGIERFELMDNGSWRLFSKTSPGEIFEIFGFNRTGETAYFWDDRNRSTLALVAIDLKSGDKTVVAQDPRVDLWDYFIIHPKEKTVQAVSFNYERMYWQAIDPGLAKDLEYLSTVTDGDFRVVSQTLDNEAWIVAYVMDDGPMRYYYYDRKDGTARLLFTSNRELEGWPLAKMHPAVIRSRDGLDLVSYYTLPLKSDPDGDGIPDAPLPMVLNVHGGPWGRDEWGYSFEHQWLANRGYAVLSINFRGSTGFGKNFTNAGNYEWGRKMQDDLIDGVNWAVQKGIADPDRIAIMGASYGGYATLAALTFTPEVFVCGVDESGISDMKTWIESMPSYDQRKSSMLASRLGAPQTEEGSIMLFERSPINHVDRIMRPLLITQGANDPVTPRDHSDRIVSAMQEKNLSVTYLLYPDEGHGLGRRDNIMLNYAVIEAFLAKHLGGRYEPIGDDLQSSSATVPVGAEEVPGLKEALKARDNTSAMP